MNNSTPSKLNHFFQAEDNFAQKYLLDHVSESSHPEIMRQHLEAQTQSINNMLATLFPDRPRLGQLFNSDSREVQKTIDVVKMLLSQRQRDLEAKNESFSNLRKLENQKNQLVIQLEKMHKDLKRLDAERENISNKLKVSEKTAKQTIDRLNADKQDWSKKYRAIEARQNQYRNEIRKQETTIKSLQEKLSRGQDKGPSKNTFEVMQQLQTYGPTFIMMNGEHEYNQMVAKTMEENYTDIANENQFLKDTLQNLQKELQTVLELKKDLLRRRRGYDSEMDTVFQLSTLNSQLINIPPAFSKQGVAILQENVSRFKEAMKVGQIGDERETQQKVNCVNNVKNLIRNYKNVVQSQEQLLNKVILKAKEFKSNEIMAIESRNSKGMEQDQLQRARRFLQEQSNYLQSKNRELQLTRRAMQNTIKKVEQQREEFIHRSNQANEDLSKIKKQVQMLPGMVEHQLNAS